MAKKVLVLMKALTAAVLLAGALVFVGCADPNNDNKSTGTGEEPLPKPEGENMLKGKVYFEGNEKIVFGEDGTYDGFSILMKNTEGNDEFVVVDDKYKYVLTATGTYTWDSTKKTVTLKAEKVVPNGAVYDENPNMVGKSAYREELEAQLSAMTQEQKDNIPKGYGFTNMEQVLDYVVSETFGNKPYQYAFSKDGKALFMDAGLPANKGTNEVVGTFHGSKYDDDSQPIKDATKTYTFAEDGTFTFASDSSFNGDEYAKGLYTFDSARKMVFLKRDTSDREIMYTSTSAYNAEKYESEAAAKAADVNRSYGRIRSHSYDLEEKFL